MAYSFIGTDNFDELRDMLLTIISLRSFLLLEKGKLMEENLTKRIFQSYFGIEEYLFRDQMHGKDAEN